MRAASNDSFAVPPSVPATASAYIDSNPPLTFAPPRMPNWLMFVIDTAPAPPERMRGMADDSATARNGEMVVSFFEPTARDRNPSSVDFTPGVPAAMKNGHERFVALRRRGVGHPDENIRKKSPADKSET